MYNRLKFFLIVCSFLVLGYGGYTWYYTNSGNHSIPYDGSLTVQEQRIIFPAINAENLHIVFLADSRWSADSRIAALQKAEGLKPNIIIDLGDPVPEGTEENFSKHYSELLAHWQKTPLFHVPGGHSRNPSQLYLGLTPYQKYFGQTDYVVEIPDFKIRLVVLDNSALGLFPHQLLWLDHELSLAKSEGYKVILNMHAPPIDPRTKPKTMLFGVNWLGEIIKRHDVVFAIFSAHTHENVETQWQGVPLEILGVSGADAQSLDKVKVWSLQITKNYTLSERHINVYEQ